MGNARKRRASLIVHDLDVSGLDFAFSVDRNLALEPNTAEISIFNLSPANRKRIGEQNGVGVQLTAGYEGSEGLIFQGVLRRVESFRAGLVDFETRIAGGDGEDAIQTSRSSSTFPPGSTLIQALQVLIADLGVGVGNLPVAIAQYGLTKFTKAFPRGMVVTGSTADELSELLRSVGLSFSIQNGEIQIAESGVPSALSVVNLTAKTGLVGSPSINDGLLAATAFLNPEIVPGGLVNVVSADVVGAFTVTRATYHGMTRSSDWYVDLEGDAVISL